MISNPIDIPIRHARKTHLCKTFPIKNMLRQLEIFFSKSVSSIFKWFLAIFADESRIWIISLSVDYNQYLTAFYKSFSKVTSCFICLHIIFCQIRIHLRKRIFIWSYFTMMLTQIQIRISKYLKLLRIFEKVISIIYMIKL